MIKGILMNKSLKFLTVSLFILPTFMLCQTKQKNVKQKLHSFFSFRKAEKINQQEIPAAAIESLSLHNIEGSVTIKTGPKKSLCIKSTIRAKNEQDLEEIKIVTDLKNNHIAIATQYSHKKIKATVEYELIVPEKLNVSVVVSDKGVVSIKDIKGAIKIAAHDIITITNPKKAVIAQAYKKGSIVITNAQGTVEAVSENGDIIAEGIANSFSARSVKGKINIVYKTLPSTSSIALKTNSGAIALALPHDTNAEIKGSTVRGILTSDLYVTLHSYTTKLDKLAWNKFRKQVDGFLGSGEATINLHSTKGNIAITQIQQKV